MISNGEGGDCGSGSGGRNYSISRGDSTKRNNGGGNNGGDPVVRGNNDRGDGGTRAHPWLSSPPPLSLVVLKRLKPISERKICRELLVLTHCTR